MGAWGDPKGSSSSEGLGMAFSVAALIVGVLVIALVVARVVGHLLAGMI